MSEIRHHLPDTFLMAYSAGTLPEAFSLVIATHVSLCDECRSRLETFDALGGAVLDQSGTVEVAENSLAATLALIAEQDAGTEKPCSTRSQAIFPAPLREYAGGDLSEVRWRSLGGGVRQSMLKAARGARVRLLCIPGGVAMPDHGHRGTEMTLVLKGAFRDEFDRFARGDVEVANEDLDHRPIAEEGEDCICLVASDAPLRFNALLPRIAQPFFRI